MSPEADDPQSSGRPDTRWRAVGTTALWIVLAIPALAQLGLLADAIAHRILYPYDLEWMEGGLLIHALRISRGTGIYVPPSFHFIPYLYTPLYPGLLALLGKVVGISYALGRAVSVAALAVIVVLSAVAIVGDADRRDRGASWCGAAVAAGFLAASYPWVGGWYDLVRADTLLVAMVVGGMFALWKWARVPGAGGQARVAAAAALLALSFFCKQTGVLYVAAGGLLLVALSWRKLPIYVATAGTIGLGGTWLLNSASGGWFWTYVYEVHQVHDFSMHRFYKSFGLILWKFPAMTLVIAVGLGAVAAVRVTRRRLPRSAPALLLWSFAFAVSCVVGAIGWGTQWAMFNAYIPAMVTGAIAAGAALPALAGCAAELGGRRFVPTAAAATAAAALAVQLVAAWWSPARFVPTARDRAAGDALIHYLSGIRGDIFIPYHPYYAVLAGKRPYVHRMGLLDLTYRHHWKVRGIHKALSTARFAAVILDNRPVGYELAGLRVGYRFARRLPRSMAPHLYSGAKVVPRSVWVRRAATRPASRAATRPASRAATTRAAPRPQAR